MDFDLFEMEEGGDILSSVQIEPTQTPTDLIVEVIPAFQCQGEDSVNSQFSADGFIKNKFLNVYHECNNKTIEHIRLTDYEFGREHLNGKLMLDFIFGNCCMHIQYLTVHIKHTLEQPKDKTFYQKRHEVTLLYHLLLHTLDPAHWPFIRPRLNRMRTLLKSIAHKETWKLLYFTHSCKGNDCNIATYHLFHGILEWTFLDLCILHKYDWNNKFIDEAQLRESRLKGQGYLEHFFEDLLICSLCLYQSKDFVHLSHLSPFPCTCVKESWLLLQLALRKWSLTNLNSLDNEKLTFWMIFNKVMEKIKSNLENFDLKTLNFSEFSNWILQALVRLQGYRSDGKYEGPHYSLLMGEDNENVEFCEKITQQFLQSNPSEKQLRVFIILLKPTLLKWWQPKVNVPMVLWEYFHKKLNTSFYVKGSALSNLAVTCQSGRSYVDKYRALLKKTPDNNVNSYTLFTVILGKCLERFIKQQANHQAQKLLGRIYSKFSVQKFFTLNETGLHHLIELFVVLALCGDLKDLAPKLRNKLLAIQLNKITAAKQVAVTKGHMALWILFAEKQYDLTEYIKKLLQQLMTLNSDLVVSKIIADTMLDVYEQSYDFHCGEHLLIGPWLTNFLNNCAPPEQDRTLEALHMIFDKSKTIKPFFDESGDLIKALNDSILPFVKQQYLISKSRWLPQLAADFCIQTFAIIDAQSFQQLFTYFIEAETLESRNGLRFLSKVLDSKRKTSIDPSTIIHIWLKNLVLIGSSNEEVQHLTKIVIELPDFTDMTNINKDEFLTAKEPLCHFITAIGKTYDSCCLNNPLKRNRIVHNLNLYWRHFDKWLPLDLNVEKSDLIFRFYSFLAIVIYNCPEVAYVKSKVTCFFHVAMTRFILPIGVQMGKAPEGKLAHLVHKIWAILMQGIGRLDIKADAYLSKTINDLIQKWTPYFKISSNSKLVARPFINCMEGDNHELSLYILNRMTQLFLSTQRRQADPNACLVITIFQEIVEAITISEDPQTEQRLMTFVKGTSLACLEHIIMVDEFVPSRTLLIDLFRRLLHSSTYCSSIELKDLVTEHLRLLTKKHLAYYTFFYFDLLMKLASISFELILSIMDFLLEEIQVVEQKRGVDKDNRIRECLQKLQQTIDVTKHNRGQSHQKIINRYSNTADNH